MAHHKGPNASCRRSSGPRRLVVSEKRMAVRQQQRTTAAVPLNERLFRLDEAGLPVLLGCRCADCGHHFFPKRAICPGCGHIGLEEAALSSRGKVWSYTVAHQAPPGAIVQAPYVIAQVELPEHVLVHTLVTECEPQDVAIGMEVELTPVRVGEDDQGRDLVAFAFRPAAAARGAGL